MLHWPRNYSLGVQCHPDSTTMAAANDAHHQMVSGDTFGVVDLPLVSPTIVDQIVALPANWHGAGVLRPEVLHTFVDLVGNQRVAHSAETGTGKSTLLLSHLSSDHKVFTKDDDGGGDSLRRVRESPLLNRDFVDFIIGPTQVTVPNYSFDHSLDLVFIDGPHGYPFPDLEYLTFYPHLSHRALFVLDDIHIATIKNLFLFLREDKMFDLVCVTGNTAFFHRTDAPTFDPLGDGWWLQQYNARRLPLRRRMSEAARARIPPSARRTIKHVINR
jgi:hypothetical protein